MEKNTHDFYRDLTASRSRKKTKTHHTKQKTAPESHEVKPEVNIFYSIGQHSKPMYEISYTSETAGLTSGSGKPQSTCISATLSPSSPSFKMIIHLAEKLR